MPLSSVLSIQWAPADLPDDVTPTWSDLTPRVKGGSIRRGRSGVFDAYGAGEMRLIVDNGDNAGGTPLFALLTWYKHRQIRCRFTGNGTHAMFTGYIDDVQYIGDEYPFTNRVAVVAHDAGGLLSELDFTGDTADLAGFAFLDGFPHTGTLTELIDAAVDRLLLPLTLDTDTYATGAPLNLPEKITGNLWQTIVDALEAEHGTLQVGGDGVLYLNGRFTPWLGFGGSPLAFDVTFTDENVDAATGRYAPLRDGLRFARPGDSYRNDITAKSRWLDEVKNVANVPAGYPAESLTRNELLWLRQPWVDANAALWSNIYATTNTYPQQMRFLCWAGNNLQPLGAGADEITAVIAAATVRLGVTNHKVEITPPGDDTLREFLVTPEQVVWEFDQEALHATLGFTSRDAWDAAYGLADGLFTLDGDAAHGLDGAGILAP